MRVGRVACAGAVILAAGVSFLSSRTAARPAASVSIRIDARMEPPRWAVLERRLLADNVPACREFFDKYFDDRGQLQCYVRWGANDGPDDAFENLNRWPELHALGAGDEILRMYTQRSRGPDQAVHRRQDDRGTRSPARACTPRTSSSSRTGCTTARACSCSTGWACRCRRTRPTRSARADLPACTWARIRTAPNYDPAHRIIRSMQNGSKGPMLRPATALDWVGDPFDVKSFDAEHGESSFEQFLAHYAEYTDVVGDHFLNVAATTLPTNAYLLTGDQKYRRWIVEYMDAWLERMRENGGIIPSHVDLEGRVGGADGRWWGGAYGWGFSPVNPVTGRREDRNRIGWALPGFGNALLVTGDQKYVDAWRTMIAASIPTRATAGAASSTPRCTAPSGWYGWRDAPWDVGAVDVWYWSQRPEDMPRGGGRGRHRLRPAHTPRSAPPDGLIS